MTPDAFLKAIRQPTLYKIIYKYEQDIDQYVQF